MEDEQAMLDMELMNEARCLAQADIPETVRRSILAEREKRAATGVKVINVPSCMSFFSLKCREYSLITKLPQRWLMNNVLLMLIKEPQF